MYVFVTYMNTETRRWNPDVLKLESGIVVTTMWVLATEPGSSVRAASVPNHWANSTASTECLDYIHSPLHIPAGHPNIPPSWLHVCLLNILFIHHFFSSLSKLSVVEGSDGLGTFWCTLLLPTPYASTWSHLFTHIDPFCPFFKAPLQPLALDRPSPAVHSYFNSCKMHRHGWKWPWVIQRAHYVCQKDRTLQEDMSKSGRQLGEKWP